MFVNAAAMWDVAASLRAVKVAMGAVTGTVWAYTASVYAV